MADSLAGDEVYECLLTVPRDRPQDCRGAGDVDRHIRVQGH
ncbi:MAG: hypothetical protein ACLU7D_12315 [Collinsella sp.]